MLRSAKTANAAPPSLKKSNSSSQSGKNQSSIANFFQKKGATEPALPINGFAKASSAKHSPIEPTSTSSLTPAPSSDAPEYGDETPSLKKDKLSEINGLPSPVTPGGTLTKKEHVHGHEAPKGFYSPSRKVDYASFC